MKTRARGEILSPRAFSYSFVRAQRYRARDVFGSKPPFRPCFTLRRPMLNRLVPRTFRPWNRLWADSMGKTSQTRTIKRIPNTNLPNTSRTPEADIRPRKVVVLQLLVLGCCRCRWEGAAGGGDDQDSFPRTRTGKSPWKTNDEELPNTSRTQPEHKPEIVFLPLEQVR